MGKTLEQGMGTKFWRRRRSKHSCSKEFEQQRNIELAKVQRLEAEARRRDAEKARRLKQERNRIAQEKEMMQRSHRVVLRNHSSLIFRVVS